MLEDDKSKGKWCARITINQCNHFYGKNFRANSKEEIQEQMKLAMKEVERMNATITEIEN